VPRGNEVTNPVNTGIYARRRKSFCFRKGRGAPGAFRPPLSNYFSRTYSSNRGDPCHAKSVFLITVTYSRATSVNQLIATRNVRCSRAGLFEENARNIPRSCTIWRAGLSFSYKKRAAAKEFPEKLGRRAGFRREERLRKVLLQIF
jgi:hypothetical protein